MATEADNVEELRSAVRDATECHFEEGERPWPRRSILDMPSPLTEPTRPHSFLGYQPPTIGNPMGSTTTDSTTAGYRNGPAVFT